MAKVGMSKLTPIKSRQDVPIIINNEEILVKQYLPINTLVQLLNEVVNYAFDIDGFISPIRYEIYGKVLIIKYFTNINITDAMIQNIDKTYDQLYLNNIINQVMDNINEDYKNFMMDLLDSTAKKIQEYNTSFVGWIRTQANDKAITEMNLNGILEELKNNENFDVLKEVVDKLE